MNPAAVIVGAGPGLAARDTSDLGALAEGTGATLVDCDAGDRDAVAPLFEAVDARPGPLEVAVYNPSARARGPVAEIDPVDVERALRVTAFGAFLMAHRAAPRMLERLRGTMLPTGASAGVKGSARSAPFAMGKFALRGLCQSPAREMHPQGVHIGHVVIDGGIASTPQSGRTNPQDGPDAMLDPDAVAQSCVHLVDQHRSAWAWEIELRAWV